MSFNQKPIDKKNKRNHFFGDGSRNLLKNLIARDLGLINPKKFIQNSNTMAIKEINLSKKRSFETQPHSVTWLNLDSVESR